LSAAQRGDQIAVADLMDALAPYVGRVCGPIALHVGPDAAQEALIAIFKNLGGLRDPRAIYGWARAIAVREAVRMARTAARAVPAELAARRHGDAIGAYADRLLDTDLPWTKMRQVYRLLGLVHRYGAGPVETACARALELDVVNVTKVASMLEKATENAAPPPRPTVAAAARFARDPA
jgi:hypothetical protein